MTAPALSTRRMPLVLAVLAAALAAAPAAAAPSATSKRAEAERILAQVQRIDAGLEHVIEAYNAAQVRLDAIVAQQRLNERRLDIARTNFARAQVALAERVRALYVSGDATVLEVLLGSATVEDVLDRVDAATRVSDQDARIVRELERYRAEMRRRREELTRAHAAQKRVLEERAARRRAIESRLAERRRLLAQVKEEIARLEAAEAARQRRREAQARARLQREAPAPAQTAPVPSPVSGAAPPARHGGVVAVAMQYLGVPYRWGGASPSTGFDCSGFVMYVYAQVGVSLPHNAAMQYGYGTPVSRDQLQAGDLVFFNGLGHNGIYIGGGQFIHAPHTGDVVKISSLSDSWYASTWVGARRL